MTIPKQMIEARTGRVRGPFIEYDCTVCGCAVSANAHRSLDRLVEQIASLNADPKKRICASCWQPAPKEGEA